jgi:alanine dehydrogenase
MALFISNDEVQELVTMPEALKAVDEAFQHFGRGTAVNHPRRRLATPKGGMQIMPAMDSETGIGGHKTYFGRGGGLCLIFEIETANVLALIQVSRLGQLRTGAASGVATQYMARKESHTLGIIGAGFQAETQIEAVCAVRPIDHISVYSRTPDRRNEFAKRIAQITGVETVSVDTAREAAGGADIICTATNSTDPVLYGEWLNEGAHVNAVGSNSLLRKEIDDTVAERAQIIAVDDTTQIDLEGGDLLSALTRGLINRSKLTDLSRIASGQVVGRLEDSNITLFKSHGIGLEDIAIAHVIYENARKQGRGIELPF